MEYTYTFGQMNNKEAVENAFKFLDLSGSMTLKDRQKAADRMVDEMPLTFHGALAYIMKGRCTVDDLVGRIPISRSTLLRLRTEERKQYNLDQVVAICIGLHLPPWLSEILLDRAHLTVKRFGPYAYYGIILDCFYMDTIKDVQEFLSMLAGALKKAAMLMPSSLQRVGIRLRSGRERPASQCVT